MRIKWIHDYGWKREEKDELTKNIVLLGKSNHIIISLKKKDMSR